MYAITDKEVQSISPYFGDFGGMILPDAFSIELHTLADDAKRILPTEDFQSLFETLLSRIPFSELRTKQTSDDGTVTLVKSQAKYYIVAGHIALAKCRGIAKLSLASENDGVLRFAAEISNDMGFQLSVFLSSRQATDETLVKDLTDFGASVDAISCVNLFDRPHMYAFQKFVGDREGTAFLADGAEVGCYPFPALSGLFASRFGMELRSRLPRRPDAVAATIQNGNGAVAAFRAFKDDACQFITVEEPVCQQFYVDSYGGATLSVRTAASGKHNNNLAGELCNLWRMAKVIRLGAENYTKTEQPTDRALMLIKERLGSYQSLLLVEGENE